MATASVKRREIVESITLVLSEEEAKVLYKFLEGDHGECEVRRELRCFNPASYNIITALEDVL